MKNFLFKLYVLIRYRKEYKECLREGVCNKGIMRGKIYEVEEVEEEETV